MFFQVVCSLIGGIHNFKRFAPLRLQQYVIIDIFPFQILFIGPESDHWLCLSVTPSLTHSLTDSCLVNLMALYDPNYLMMSQQLLF